MQYEEFGVGEVNRGRHGHRLHERGLHETWQALRRDFSVCRQPIVRRLPPGDEPEGKIRDGGWATRSEAI